MSEMVIGTRYMALSFVARLESERNAGPLVWFVT